MSTAADECKLRGDCAAEGGTSNPRALMLYLEPASYIVGLIGEVRAVWKGELEVRFVAGKYSQRWNYDGEYGEQGPTSRSVFHTIMEVYRLLRSGRYELVHLAGWGNPVLLSAMLVAASLKIPVTVESDTPLPHRQPILKSIIKAILYRALFRIPAVFLPGGSAQRTYLRHYGVDDGRIKIARMTSDVAGIIAYREKFDDRAKSDVLRRYGLPENDVKLLYLGRLEPYKGVTDLIDAYRKVRPKMSAVSLVVAGDGSLASLVAAEASRDPSIYRLGQLTGEQVWEALCLADVLVLPSRYDGWGLVINEAMAARLPVIVTDRVGCRDDLVDDATGLVVPGESAEALASAMETLAGDAGLRRRMGAAAQRRISNWTLRNSALTTVNAWRQALT